MGSTSDRVTSVVIDAASPPVTPPTKSSGPNAGSVSQSTLPSPPPSSSSRHSHIVDQDELDYYNDNNSNTNRSSNNDAIHNQSSLDKIARRLSSSIAGMPTKPGPGKKATPIITKTHSISSSTSSLASSNQISSNVLSNKHLSVTKTKTLGHLTRSTSSEVDNEVANALASGRSIVSKTDWKEEDAQYLVQLIETQFPKGNIIWDWVGHQMVDRGFTKSQCRSKWKRIRTKVLHGDGNPHTKDRDQVAQEQEVDELNEDEYEELPTDIPDLKWRHQQADQEISTNQSQSARSNGAYDRPQYAYRTGPTARDEDLATARRSQHSNRAVTHSAYSKQTADYSDDEKRRDLDNFLHPAKRFSDYPERERTPPSQSLQHHRRTSSSNYHHATQGDDSVRPATSLSTIAATPTVFGKIEWKPEDSDFLVHLIETKFASRKVDWAYVSKQMEGRGYDRTQCKSRWWRVQHRQSQNQQNQGGSASLLSRGGRPRKNIDRRESQSEIDQQLDDEKEKTSDTEGNHVMQTPENRPVYRKGQQQHQQPDSVAMRSPSISSQQHTYPTKSGNNRAHYPQDADHRERQEDEESQGNTEDHVRSPRVTRGHEHQKHIEWKEEDSQYMFRMIEREFPVGNVVWSVIGERMASRGYSQTQCMSKWRRHLKNNKAMNDSTTGGRTSGISVDLDADMEVDGASSYNAHRENRLTGFRRPRKEDLLIYGDNRGSHNNIDHMSSKRTKSDVIDSRAYDRDDYRSPVAQLDARLVEMEFDRYFNVGNKRRRATEDEEGYGNKGYVERESYPDNYYDRDIPTYEGEQAHRRQHHHYRRMSNEMHPDDYSRRSNYSQDEHASSKSYGEHEEIRRKSPILADESVTAVEGEAASVVGLAGSMRPFDSERNSHDDEQRHGSREWDTSMAIDNEREESSSMPFKSKHRESHSSKSHYMDENNSRYYYDERESMQTSMDQNKEARHRPQEPARYDEPIGRSPDRDLVGTTHTPSSSSFAYSNRPSSDGYRDREMASRRGDDIGAYDLIDRDERYYRDQQSQYRRRSHHQPSIHNPRRPVSPEQGDRDDVVRNGGYYDDGYSKRRHRQFSPNYEHRRSQDYGHSHRRDIQHLERDNDYIDYIMEDDLDWANGRWEGRDMARLAAAVARQGRRWDAIRAQIRIPVLVNPYDDYEYRDIYEGFRFEPHASTMSTDRYSRPQHYQSSLSSSHSHQRYNSSQSHQQQHRQYQPSYQQPMREDSYKSAVHRIHHRSSSSAAPPVTTGLAEIDVSPHQTSSPVFSSKKTSGIIASVSYTKNDAFVPQASTTTRNSETREKENHSVTVPEPINTEEASMTGAQGDVGDPDSTERDQSQRNEEEESEQDKVVKKDNRDDDVSVEVDRNSSILEKQDAVMMEVDDEKHQEMKVADQMTSPNATKTSSEAESVNMQSPERDSTAETSTVTTTLI
ncbi:hypothetical protein FBU30_004408 [Linnemannia zychae]|nr:hypothetical protein FBU30_004408 [Linnemannia zychae]